MRLEWIRSVKKRIRSIGLMKGIWPYKSESVVVNLMHGIYISRFDQYNFYHSLINLKIYEAVADVLSKESRS